MISPLGFTFIENNNKNINKQINQNHSIKVDTKVIDKIKNNMKSIYKDDDDDDDEFNLEHHISDVDVTGTHNTDPIPIDSIGSHISTASGPNVLSGSDHTENKNNGTELLTRLNYMIHLLEEQQEQRTEHVMEELILYCFLGIFIIFVIDSFVRVGRYTR